MTNEPWHEGMLVGFDLETTGPDPHTDLPIQVGFQVSTFNNDAHSPYPALSYERYVNPGVPITNSEIHGITDEMVADAPDVETTIVRLASDFRQLVQRTPVVPIVIYNAPFDWTMFKRLCDKYEVNKREFDFDEAVIIDPLVMDKELDKYRRGSRKQVDVGKHYGVEVVGTLHTAGVDADLAVQIARAIGRKYQRYSRFDALKEQPLWGRTQQRSLQAYFDKKRIDKKVDIGWPVYEKSVGN